MFIRQPAAMHLISEVPDKHIYKTSNKQNNILSCNFMLNADISFQCYKSIHYGLKYDKMYPMVVIFLANVISVKVLR